MAMTTAQELRQAWQSALRPHSEGPKPSVKEIIASAEIIKTSTMISMLEQLETLNSILTSGAQREEHTVEDQNAFDPFADILDD